MVFTLNVVPLVHTLIYAPFSGSFAVVKQATCRKDGSEWAVKCIDKGKLQKEDEEALKVEVEILEKVGGWLAHVLCWLQELILPSTLVGR